MAEGAKVAIVTGGTGGHIFPALALEKEFKKSGSVKKVDIISIPSYGFIGKKFHKKILALIFGIWGLFKSIMLLKKEAPDIACGFGGHGTVAYLLACYMCRVPFILHEQNLIPGRTTRVLSRFSKEVLISFPDSQELLPSAKTFFTGNLSREDFTNYHRSLRSSGYEPENKKIILVVGGSQGSHFLNRNLPEVLLKILDDFPGLSIVHISGEKERELVKDMYSSKTPRVNVIDFFPDILSLLKDARLVISRAGATILSEICLCGIPSILIPFRESSDNHQYHNAIWFRERAAAFVIEEKGFTEDFFYSSLRDLLDFPAQLKKMSSALLKLSQPNAVKLAKERILECYKRA